MTKLSELIMHCSNVLDIRDTTVREVARRLREADQIKTGGRGRGGADMSPEDGASLIMAFLGGSDIILSPKTVRLCRQMALFQFEGDGKPDWGPMKPGRFLGLPKQHTFGDALARILEIAQKREWPFTQELDDYAFKRGHPALPSGGTISIARSSFLRGSIDLWCLEPTPAHVRAIYRDPREDEAGNTKHLGSARIMSDMMAEIRESGIKTSRTISIGQAKEIGEYL